MTLLRACSCGQMHPEHQPCPTIERARNQDPNRKAHHTQRYFRLRRYVLNRDNHICQICSGYGNECDFITPLAHGGPMTTANARCLCKTCNSRRGATTRRRQ